MNSRWKRPPLFCSLLWSFCRHRGPWSYFYLGHVKKCNVILDLIFSRTLLRYVRLMAWAVRLSSVCLSSVTFVRAAQKVELLRNILHSQIAQGLGQFVLKSWAKNRRGSTAPCKLNTRRYDKLVFFSTNISLCFKNGTRRGHGRRIETRMRSLEWCHFQWPSMTPNIDFKSHDISNVK